MKLIYNHLLLLVLTLSAISCTDRHYQIDGIFTTDDGTKVYLIDLERADTLGVTEVRDGRFSFTGKVKEPCYVYVGRERTRVHLILEPGVVTADIDERVCYGTPMEDDYMAFHRRFYGFKRDQRAEKAVLADSVVRANRDKLVGALALEDLAYVDTTCFLSLYAQLPARFQQFFLVRKAYDAIQLQNRTAPGRMFTDYTITGGNPDGTDVKLSDYVGRGKYILLDHWASWCGPCKAEMPYIKKTWEAFAGDRFDVVSIAVSDKRADTEAALAKLDMPWHQILDGQKIPQELYGISAIPHLILFAPDGTILQRGLRGEQIYDAVSEILSNGTSLFNGEDLSGWKVVLREDDQTLAPTFTTDDGILHISGQPFGYIRTEKEFSDYKLHMEWRWAGGEAVDGGIFHYLQGEDKVWPQGVQLQMTPGDMGMLMGGIPIEGVEGPFYRKSRLTQESPEKPVGEWNTFDFECHRGHIKAFLNGVLVNEITCQAEKGHIGIQSEGGAMDVRNIRLKED